MNLDTRFSCFPTFVHVVLFAEPAHGGRGQVGQPHKAPLIRGGKYRKMKNFLSKILKFDVKYQSRFLFEE